MPFLEFFGKIFGAWLSRARFTVTGTPILYAKPYPALAAY
jgi:hypothetical protein